MACLVLALCVPSDGESVAESDSLRERPDVVVYYFHQTARCDNCLKFEEYSRRAVEEGFPGELEAGRIVWQAVNVDEPGNERFVEEYDVFESAVVLVRPKDEGTPDWRKLDAIWSLVGEPELFVQYVRSEVDSFLAGDDWPSEADGSAARDTLAPARGDTGSGAGAPLLPPDARHEGQSRKE